MLRTLLASPLQQCRAIAASVQQLALLASTAADGVVPVCPSVPQQQQDDSSLLGRTTGSFGTLSACRSYSSGVATPLAAASGSSTPGAYAVEIAVQAFEKRYVDMACNTISDMVLLAFAPKSYGVLPVGSPSPSQLPVNLAFGAKRRDVRLPWRRTRFTLIRGPHIDKKGMEQFERREYKSVMSASTNSADELHRLLEALKIYQFTGVQLKIQVQTAQQLQLPSDLASLGIRSAAAAASLNADSTPATSSGEAPGGIGSPVAVLPAPRSAEALFAEELDSVLRLLRPLVYQGLEQRRRQLGSEPEYQAWLRQQAAVPTPVALSHQQRGSAAAPGPNGASGGAGAAEGATAVVEALEAAAGGAVGGELYGKLLRMRLQQQLERQRQGGSPGGAAEGGGGGGAGDGAAGGGSDPRDGGATSYLQDARTAAELLARIDAELLHAHQVAVGGGETPGSSGSSPSTADAGAGSAVSYSAPPTLDPATMSPAEYAHAVLQYVRYVDGLYGAAPQGTAQGQASTPAGSSGGAATVSAASSSSDADLLLQVQGPSVALRLLEMWWAATSAEFRQHLALPPVGAEGVLGAAILRRRQAEAAAKAAAAAGGSGGPADGGAGRSGR